MLRCKLLHYGLRRRLRLLLNSSLTGSPPGFVRAGSFAVCTPCQPSGAHPFAR